ncbi:50S ribosomal protein L18 [Candidatus Saccharibacteria bacterium]|nr:ribosomal protein L18 [uncultured bacterium]PID30589.1 MAG: 50S ribosomal protein L18 [Candidatus Saccharibacteria bacterium]PID99329.1 MAG: 50S ribosomal protein L18 [Candidatus Saccharibacteria bacterium]
MGKSLKLQNRAQRKHRIRATVKGTSDRPRLSVHVSNTNVSAQIIDDSKDHTLAAATSVGSKSAKGTLTEKAAWVGAEIAAAAKKAKVTTVVFDRGGKQYHGRIKALAEAAREKGLEF